MARIWIDQKFHRSFSEDPQGTLQLNGVFLPEFMEVEFQKPDSSAVIQGEFSLKNLSYFIKCTNLCSSIEVYLENDLPLVVKYAVASLGSIKLCLAPLPSS